nr:hypothetical protein [uncultured Halomonas sp.]
MRRSTPALRLPLRARSTPRALSRGFALSALALALTGCASWGNGPSFDDKVMFDDDEPAVIRDISDSWSTTPAMQRVAAASGDGIQIRGPVDLPPEIRDAPIDISLPGYTSLDDLAGILAARNVLMVPLGEGEAYQSINSGNGAPRISASPNMTPDEQLLASLQSAQSAIATVTQSGEGSHFNERAFKLPHYKGTVGGLLRIVSLLTNTSFHWDQEFILASPGVEYYVDLPQDDELIGRVVADLESLGAENITASMDAGTVVFSAGSKKDSLLRDYMNRLVKNNAMIGLQVAIVTVSHNRERNTGFDWSSLQATVKGGAAAAMDVATNGASEVASSAVDATTTAASDGLAATFGDSRLNLLYSGSDFQLSGLLNFLSSYGTTETKQNLVLRTLSANPVEIRSGQSTPYVSEVNTSSTGDVINSGTETDVAETGLTVNIEPRFNSRNELITMSVDLELSSIIAFLELNAGGEGTITQPDIQEQSFQNTARLRAGETVILGGLTYDEVTDRLNTLTPLEKMPFEGQRYRRQQNSLFVVLRPTITLYD